MSHEEQAKALFMDGCNCAQAAFCAFCDVTGLEKELAMRLSSSFGGGMGRLREVCGALSGIFMAAGILYGYDDLTDKSLKTDHYEQPDFGRKMVPSFAGRFWDLRKSTAGPNRRTGLRTTTPDVHVPK